jgi:hypothetical protein
MTWCCSYLARSTVFRWLLVVSLWEGPVLWGHVHAVGEAGLGAHLQRCHLHDADPFGLGWHWHLSWPEPGDSETSHKTAQSTAHPPRLLTKPLQGAGHEWAGPSAVAVPTPWVSPGPLALGHGRASGSLLPAGISPQILLCRLSC